MPRRLLYLLFPALVIFWNLGYAPFWNPDEGRYASASYEMAFGLGPSQPDWIVPHLNTVARLNKPPLVYWMTGTAFKLFGPSEWSGRLSTTLAALLVMGVIYAWGTRVWSFRVGLGAALVWATTAFPAAMSRTCNTDMLLAASITLAAFGLFWMLEGNERFKPALLAGLGMGLALLSKGPVGVALPVAITLLYVLVGRRWKQISWQALGLSIGIALLIGVPWYLAVEAQRPGFIHRFIFEENLGRFTGKESFHDKTNPFYYLPILLGGFFPWTAFLLPTFATWREKDDLARRSQLFLVLWSAFILLFFSASSTKLISYILPAFPALALLVGATVARWEMLTPRLRSATIALSVFISLLLCVMLTTYPKRNKLTKSWQMVPGILTDGKIISPKDGAVWSQQLCILLVFGVVLLLVSSRRSNSKTMLAVQGGYGALVIAGLLNLAGGIAHYDDGSGVVSVLPSLLKPEDEVVGYRSFMPATMYYAQRPGTFFYFRNSSGLDAKELAASPYFTMMKERNDLKGWLAKRSNRVFIVTQGFIDPPLRPIVFQWGRNNDFFLYSNRPKPADFLLDTVAPSRRKAPKVHRNQPEESK